MFSWPSPVVRQTKRPDPFLPPNMHKAIDFMSQPKCRLLICLVAAILATCVYYFQPRSYSPPLISGVKAYYHGFGLTRKQVWYGRIFDRVEMVEFFDCTTVVEVCGSRYCQFRSFGKEGHIVAEGRCLVEILGEPAYPLPDVD